MRLSIFFMVAGVILSLGGMSAMAYLDGSASTHLEETDCYDSEKNIISGSTCQEEVKDDSLMFQNILLGSTTVIGLVVFFCGCFRFGGD